jgi:hypothetical protein
LINLTVSSVFHGVQWYFSAASSNVAIAFSISLLWVHGKTTTFKFAFELQFDFFRLHK